MIRFQKIFFSILSSCLVSFCFSPSSVFANEHVTFKNISPEDVANPQSVILSFWGLQGNAHCKGSSDTNPNIILQAGESIDCSFSHIEGITDIRVAVRALNMCAQLCNLWIYHGAKNVALAPEGNCAYVKSGNVFLIGPNKTGPAVLPPDPCHTSAGDIC